MENIKIKPIERKSLYREEIRDYLMKSILSGGLKPGDRIVETRWAKELGVSQSPVREAIREFEMMGLVETIPYKGTYVREITNKDIRDSYVVRMTLEALGARDAVRCITDEQIDDLYKTMKEMERAANDKDFDRYVEYDDLFHLKIMNVSSNKILNRVWKQCEVKQWTHIGTKISDKALDQLAMRHEAIYDAIASRDEERAVLEVTNHIKELMNKLD